MLVDESNWLMTVLSGWSVNKDVNALRILMIVFTIFIIDITFLLHLTIGCVDKKRKKAEIPLSLRSDSALKKPVVAPANFASSNVMVSGSTEGGAGNRKLGRAGSNSRDSRSNEQPVKDGKLGVKTPGQQTFEQPVDPADLEDYTQQPTAEIKREAEQKTQRAVQKLRKKFGKKMDAKNTKVKDERFKDRTETIDDPTLKTNDQMPSVETAEQRAKTPVATNSVHVEKTQVSMFVQPTNEPTAQQKQAAKVHLVSLF
ncbi:hypothetical protein M3Y96_00371500 [Aphelenchoides besseyi]|nr:hypothetical protein M3Y96_00371500 [Aphelenchoides besseyi]